MPDNSHRWKAVATFRQTHDKKVSVTGHFDEIAEIDQWLETGLGFDWRALDTLVITYDLTDENLTLTQIAAEQGEHLRVVPTEEPPVAN